jgi:hypothetical protein
MVKRKSLYNIREKTRRKSGENPFKGLHLEIETIDNDGINES